MSDLVPQDHGDSLVHNRDANDMVLDDFGAQRVSLGSTFFFFFQFAVDNIPLWMWV